MSCVFAFISFPIMITQTIIAVYVFQAIMMRSIVVDSFFNTVLRFMFSCIVTFMYRQDEGCIRYSITMCKFMFAKDEEYKSLIGLFAYTKICLNTVFMVCIIWQIWTIDFGSDYVSDD